jgi:hypothetical protein
MKNIIRLACDFFGCQPDSDLFDAFRKANDESLTDLLQQYRAHASGERLSAPDLANGELRPYLPTAETMTSHTMGHLRLEASTFQDMGKVWNAIDAIKHRLLYCHSVAIDECFGEIVHDAIHRKTYNEGINHREVLLNYVNFILHLKPLIEDNVLCLVAQRAYNRWPGQRVHENALANLVDSYVKHKIAKNFEIRKGFPQLSPIDYARYVDEDVVNDWTQARFKKKDWALLQQTFSQFEIRRMRVIFSTVEDLPRKVTPYLPTRNSIKLLNAAISEFSKKMPTKSDAVIRDLVTRQNTLLTELIDLQLPGLAKLSPEDMVAIRAGDSFENWRATLQQALRHAAATPADFSDRGEAIRSDVRQVLIPAKEKLEQEFSRSSMLSRVRAPSTQFVTGGLGILAAYFINPTASLVVAGAAVAGKLVEVLSKSVVEGAVEGSNRPRHSRYAELNHYVAMLD